MFLPNNVQILKAIDIKEVGRLSTGSLALDRLLKGGLPNEGIFEITGESGCGKSQLCQQLTLTVQYPLQQGGYEGGAIYICTEEVFQSKRLYQLIEHFPKRYYKHANNQINFGDNIVIVHVSDFENLEKCLERISCVIRSKNIKILIIDSITALFRGNYTESESQKKVKDLRTIGSLLHHLSMLHQLLIVCVNQVAQSLEDGQIVPALGLAWANLVTERIMLTRMNGRRYAHVVYSPELPSGIKVEYAIQTSGIN